MKIAVLIPDRGDRPYFIGNCKRLLYNQTLQPDHVEIVDWPAVNDDCDITMRYRFGYQKLSQMGFDVILLMENDDYYAPNYIETMINEWVLSGKPELFGTTYTYYYSLVAKGRFTMEHLQRSSAMSTLIKPCLDFEWPLDNDPYTDVWLFHKLKYKLFTPKETICIGIKHGVGKCGGECHTNNLERFSVGPTALKDPDMVWLRANVDPDSFKFYQSISNSQNSSK